MEKHWQKTEIAYLKRHADAKSLEQLAVRLNTDPETVRIELEKLGLRVGGAEAKDDPALSRFENAIKFLHSQKWAKAAAELEAVIEASDGLQLRDRARQHLAICHQHLEEQETVEDPYLRAVVAKNRGELDEALALCTNTDREERFAYLAASILALRGDGGDAVSQLRTAIELEPKNRVHAYHDPDFEALRDDDAFSELITNAGPGPRNV